MTLENILYLTKDYYPEFIKNFYIKTKTNYPVEKQTKDANKHFTEKKSKRPINIRNIFNLISKQENANL